MPGKVMGNRILSLAAGGLLVAFASWGEAQQDIGRTYEFLFEPGSDQLRSSSTNSGQLVAARELLRLHTGRDGITFKIVGHLPPACSSNLKCVEARLLQLRVQKVLDAIESRWPGEAGRNSLSQVLWGSSARSMADKDAVQIILVKTMDQSPPLCPAEVQIADPEMPTMQGTDGIAWLDASPKSSIAVTGRAKLRIASRNSNSRVRVLFSGPAIEITDWEVGHLMVGYRVYSLDFSGPFLAVQVTEITERQGILNESNEDRTVGDSVQTWSIQPAQSPTDCVFRFERWRVGQ